MRRFAILIGLGLCSGCAHATVEPGHRALLFNPNDKGLHHEVLGPGRYSIGVNGRLEDFDVTYSTRKEIVHTTSSEGLQLELHFAVIYRPVVSELYELDTEIGPNYYDEVVGPEFRSAARGVFARHSYTDLMKQNEKIEDEVEGDLRRRITGKHVEVASVTMEGVQYAPEIGEAVRARLVGEQEAARRKAAIENDALRAKVELANQAEQNKLKAESVVREKESERMVAEQEAKIEKVKAESALIRAKSEAEQRTLLAKAYAEEKKAEAKSITWLEVQMHAYDALAKLGGEHTHFFIGDWSKLPNFLFPPGFPAGAHSPMAPANYTPPPAGAPIKPIFSTTAPR